VLFSVIDAGIVICEGSDSGLISLIPGRVLFRAQILAVVDNFL
jgi:hypothetical protein